MGMGRGMGMGMGMGRGMGMGMGMARNGYGYGYGMGMVWVWDCYFTRGNFQPLTLMLLHKPPYMSQQCCGKDSAKFGVQSINQFMNLTCSVLF